MISAIFLQVWGDIPLQYYFALSWWLVTLIASVTLLLCFLAICTSSLGICLFRSSAHFSIRLFFFTSNLYEFFLYVECWALIRYMIYKYFLPLLGCLLIFLKCRSFLIWFDFDYFVSNQILIWFDFTILFLLPLLLVSNQKNYCQDTG